MDIRSAQIPLESIPSANDYSAAAAAAYEYVYPEIHGARSVSYACDTAEKGSKHSAESPGSCSTLFMYLDVFLCTCIVKMLLVMICI